MLAAPPLQTHDIDLRGQRFRVALQGQGPPVVFLHGFPESAHSWRHQMAAVSAAGYRAVAPNQRGYADSYSPAEVEAYDLVELAADAAALIDVVGGGEPAVVVGHDWGAPVAYHTSLLYPDKVRAVAGLSVPFAGRPARSPLQAYREAFKDVFFYILYFQRQGVAEAELEQDVRKSLSSFYYSRTGDAAQRPRLPVKGTKVLDFMRLSGPLPDWHSDADLDSYVAQFERSGFRGPLNWYRNFDRSWERTAPLADKPITQPAMFLAGGCDPVLLFSAHALQRMPSVVPDLRIHRIVDGAGHWLQRERPEVTSEVLLEFLSGL